MAMTRARTTHLACLSEPFDDLNSESAISLTYGRIKAMIDIGCWHDAAPIRRPVCDEQSSGKVSQKLQFVIHDAGQNPDPHLKSIHGCASRLFLSPRFLQCGSPS